MKRLLSVLFLATALLSMGAFAWAAFEKAEPAELTTDVTPEIGPTVPSTPVDNMWDLDFGFNAGLAANDVLLLGAACVNGNFYVTGSGLSSTVPSDNKIYKFSSTGTLLATYNQPDVASGWGFRDLAYDGTYLYAGCEGPFAYAFDLNGNMVPAMNVPKPAGCALIRALTYDPVTDHFWTGNFGSAIFEFDRTGAVVWTGPAGLSGVYGMAWDNVDPLGPWIWIYDQSGSPVTTMKKYNPATHTIVGSIQLPDPPGFTGSTAGGCEMTNSYDPSWWQMVCLDQATPNDPVLVYEMYLALDPLAPAAPTGFTVANNGPALMASLAWTNPTTTINGNPLLSISSIIVKRGGTQIATLSGTPGQAMTYNDNVPSVGMYNYQVYCTNSYGDGNPASGGAWIGLDTPGPVTGATGSGVGTTLVAVINWVNPTAGGHGGYWPIGSITGYTINRYGPSTGTANLMGLNTTFTEPVPMQGWYHYGIIAYNGSGNSPEVMTPNFYVGPPEMQAIPFNWVEINAVGTNTGITGDDQNLGPFPMGFNFNHYGTMFNSIRVCSNGFLSFTSTATSFTNYAIPTAAEPNNLIAPFWDDMYPPGPPVGIIYYYYDAANSRFIVEWDNVLSYTSPRTPQKFEAIFYPNGDIDFMYHTIQAPCVNTSTVGKENATGTVGVQATFNGSGPLEPASSTGIRIFGQPAGTPNVTITLTPVAPPIQIPGSGGSFDFNVEIHNGELSAMTFDAWIMVQLPNMAWYGPVLGPINLTLAPSFTLSRTRTQNVPASAPTGNYLYEGRVGTYPGVVWHTGNFPFVKLAVGDGTPVPEWANYGESFELGQAAQQPAAFALLGARPNPFNPTTTIGFALPEAAKVTLSVYDISGRQVATLVNGWRNAGSHEVVFDGSALASGIYIYRLSADNLSAVGKMVLMK